VFVVVDDEADFGVEKGAVMANLGTIGLGAIASPLALLLGGFWGQNRLKPQLQRDRVEISKVRNAGSQ